MDFKKMEYFIAAAEEGTFTKAASRCYISQTAISQQIAGLEKELDVSLFDRTHYRPKLTPAGVRFYEYSKRIFNDLNEAVKEVKALDRVNKKQIDIGITSTFERIMLTSLLKKFVKAYPDIVINLKEHTISECVEKVKEGELDLLFTLHEEIKAENKIDIFPLYIDKVCIITPTDHKFANRKVIKGKELKGEEFVVFSPKENPCIHRSFLNACKKDGYLPIIAQKVESPWDLAIMVSLGKGIAISSLDIRLDDTVLSTVRLEDSAHKAEYCLVKANNNTTKEITDFIKMSINAE